MRDAQRHRCRQLACGARFPDGCCPPRFIYTVDEKPPWLIRSFPIGKARLCALPSAPPRPSRPRSLDGRIECKFLRFGERTGPSHGAPQSCRCLLPENDDRMMFQDLGRVIRGPVWCDQHVDVDGRGVPAVPPDESSIQSDRLHTEVPPSMDYSMVEGDDRSVREGHRHVARQIVRRCVGVGWTGWSPRHRTDNVLFQHAPRHATSLWRANGCASDFRNCAEVAHIGRWLPEQVPCRGPPLPRRLPESRLSLRASSCPIGGPDALGM